MKPYYQNESVTLYHGDCLEVMPDLTMTFDACITDPPYGTTAVNGILLYHLSRCGRI